MGEIFSLKPITEKNWEKAINLNVREAQKNFVASNLYSIAQAQFLPDFKAMGVFKGEAMVGFALYGVDSDDGNYWITRLMVDKSHQGKGYGKAALHEVLNDINTDNIGRSIPYVMISYEPENLVAKQLYLKAGFVETDMATWGEQMARLELGVSENDTNHIVLATIAHKKHYVELAHSLWPTSTKEDLAATYHDIVPSSRNRILFYKENNEIVAFMHLSIREDYVEGSESSPTGYVEGVFVLEEHRRKGFSKKLLHAGESWLKARGCQQIGSDIHLENEISYYFHTSLGFQESSRLIAFIKSIE